ncbi:MAG: DUF3098 domain-containing protein [Chitinophagales bacterium]|nr:DUF3098 domain-containing protein [Chitinophagales bacterium]
MAKTQTSPLPKQSTIIRSKKTVNPISSQRNLVQHVFLFNRENYIVLGIGLALLIVGYLLMAGGNQPPDKWDPNVIYSFRRITLSTIVVLSGFVVIIFSIFWKRKFLKY